MGADFNVLIPDVPSESRPTGVVGRTAGVRFDRSPIPVDSPRSGHSEELRPRKVGTPPCDESGRSTLVSAPVRPVAWVARAHGSKPNEGTVNTM